MHFNSLDELIIHTSQSPGLQNESKNLWRLSERTEWRSKGSVYFALILDQMISDLRVLICQVLYCQVFKITICQFLLYFNIYILVNLLNIGPFTNFLYQILKLFKQIGKANVHETKLCVSSNLNEEKPLQMQSLQSNLDLMACLWDSMTPWPWQKSSSLMKIVLLYFGYKVVLRCWSNNSRSYEIIYFFMSRCVWVQMSTLLW